ncbi:SDR family oxidoreductase [Streptomyces sp. NBC_00091]|uniref:SDR family oxidoreductase n=1 Tax=Streptomyces sp. NBC_00091 TaxID=2975648 RepID=UPI00224D5339|nr:SDR family oxidoreductase [Streptomyces sp. NBC_00091]MCX5381496.1 SDR family oxidoreductase [Streptomyces sp. NBC_00091]
MPAPTILVTGASGVVGSALLRALDGAHARVIALTHHKPVPGRHLRGDVTRPWLGLHPDDYRELAAEVDVVVHCAASVNFTASPTHLYNVNVRGTGHVLSFTADARARLVHTSTAFIARAGNGSSMDGYAASKATGETLVRESGLPAAVVRLSTITGDSRSGEIARHQAFHHLLGAAMAGQLPFLPHHPGTAIDFVPQDIAAAGLAALALTDPPPGDYWITAGAAALPAARILDLAYRAATAPDRRRGDAPEVDPRLFRTRLLDPAVTGRVITAVLSRTPVGTPSLVQHAAKFMLAFNGAAPFPTSLGTLPGGPAAPTAHDLEEALRGTLAYILDQPEGTWA